MWPFHVNVIQALDTTAQGTTSRNIRISNLTSVTLFFLLRTGKYCKGGNDTAHYLFRFRDVQFFIGQQPYNAVMESNVILA